MLVFNSLKMLLLILLVFRFVGNTPLYVPASKSFKNEAKVVEEGNECGLSIQGYKNFKAGDIVECYQQTETQVEL